MTDDVDGRKLDELAAALADMHKVLNHVCLLAAAGAGAAAVLVTPVLIWLVTC